MLKTFDFRNRFCCVWMTEPKCISSQYVSSASVVKICQTFLFGIFLEYVRIKQFRWDLNGRFFYFAFFASGGLRPSVYTGLNVFADNLVQTDMYSHTNRIRVLNAHSADQMFRLKLGLDNDTTHNPCNAC